MIVYIITKLELGGAQKVCLALAKGVANVMHTALISGTEGVLVPSTQELKNVYLLPSMQRDVRILGLLDEVKNFIILRNTLRRLKKAHPELIVHTHSTKAGIIGRWAALFAGVKHRVHTIHGYGFHDHLSRAAWLMRFIPEYLTSLITTHFVCVSEHDQQTGIKWLPGFAKKNSLIRAAVDYEKFYTPAFLPSYRTEKPFVIGTISCMKPQKNIFDLLQAFHTVYQTVQRHHLPAPRLEIIGDGEQRSQIEAWIAQRELQDHIRLLGWQAEVQQFLKQWDLFALSSLWEGLPCAIIEARLSHLPIIAYNVGGIAEVVRNGHNGYLVTPGDKNALAEKMIHLALHPSIQQALAAKNDDLIDFDNKSMVKKHTTLYKSLLSINEK
ncbi:glycosyltransferase family 4 protein [Candidatus Dependentiae bacterium]|nr:glycosyltransferase family 4 protein [Candidatus Dependentiae bacterium]